MFHTKRLIASAVVLSLLSLGAGANAGAAPLSPKISWTTEALVPGQFVTLADLISTNSNGRKSWTVKGDCVFANKRTDVVRLRSAGVCRVGLKIAKTSRFRARTTSRVIRIVSFGHDPLSLTHSAGGLDADEGRDVSVSVDGSAFVVGTFRDQASFESMGINQSCQVCIDPDDTQSFIARLSPRRFWYWVRSPSGDGYSIFNSVSTQADGSALVGGAVYGQQVFGVHKVSGSTKGSAFVAKISSDGSWIWATSVGNSHKSEILSVASKQDGTVVVGGWFEKSLNIGTQLLTKATSQDGFAAGLSTSGVWTWSFVLGVDTFASVVAVASAPSGEIIIASNFKSAANFQFSNLTPSGQGGLVGRLTPSGQLLWGAMLGAYPYGSANIYGLDVLPTGDAVVVGTSSYSVSLVPVPQGATSRIPTSPSEWTIEGGCFFARISTGGAWTWGVGRDSGLGLCAANSVSALSDGSVVVAGTFTQSLVLGGSELASEKFGDVDNLYRQYFVARLSRGGKWLWAVGSGKYAVVSIDGGLRDSAVITGYFSGPLTLGAVNLAGRGWDVLVGEIPSAGSSAQ